jgi:hypothetical protein
MARDTEIDNIENFNDKSGAAKKAQIEFSSLAIEDQAVAEIFIFMALLLNNNDSDFASTLASAMGMESSDEVEEWRKDNISEGKSFDRILEEHDYRGFDFGKAANVIYSTTPIAGLLVSSGKSMLDPKLVEKMQESPEIESYVNKTLEVAAQYENLDGVMLANQFWHESRFDAGAESGAGARGIAQIMPFHEGDYGLDNKSDFYDAETSIRAGAQMMSELTGTYGSQRLALVAYNGGGGAIEYAQDSLGKENISVADWMDFMEDQRALHGADDRTKWRVQTYEYVRDIDSSYWSEERLQEASAAMASIDGLDPNKIDDLDRPASTHTLA